MTPNEAQNVLWQAVLDYGDARDKSMTPPTRELGQATRRVRHAMRRLMEATWSEGYVAALGYDLNDKHDRAEWSEEPQPPNPYRNEK